MQNDETVGIHDRLRQAEDHLAAADPQLSELIDKIGPCTMFDKGSLYEKTAFHMLVWAIINQQLSVASARSIERKLLRHHCDSTFRHRTISSLSEPDLRNCGLSRQKIRYLRALTEAVDQKTINLRSLSDKPNHDVECILTNLPGIGPWSVHMYLMFYLARLDVLPLGDLALRKAISITYSLNDRDEMEQLANMWSPYESIASWYLWNVVD